MRPERVGEISLVVAVVTTVLAVSSTWTRSGRRERNGIGTLEALDGLDLLAPPRDLALVVVTGSLPLLLAASALGLATHRRALVAASASAAALVLLAWSVVVLRSPLAAAPGPHLAVVAASALAVTTVATLRAQRQRN